MTYWLFKSEPDVWGWDHQVAKGAVEGAADGVSEKVSAAATSVKEAVKKRLPNRKRDPEDKGAKAEPVQETDESRRD